MLLYSISYLFDLFGNIALAFSTCLDIQKCQEDKDNKENQQILKNMLARWIIYNLFVFLLEPVVLIIFGLLPFGIEYIILVTIKFYLILPGSGIYLKMYKTLEKMEMDSYIDEGFPHYLSIFLRKSILTTLKWNKYMVKYIHLHHQEEIVHAIDEVKDVLQVKDMNVRASMIKGNFDSKQFDLNPKIKKQDEFKQNKKEEDKTPISKQDEVKQRLIKKNN